MQLGPYISLNFYSNEIEVRLDESHNVYVNWDHYRDMLDLKHDVPASVIFHVGDDRYVSLSYLTMNVKELVRNIELPLFGQLVVNEFFSYIVKELALVRDILPLIEIDYNTYLSGIVEYGKTYVLPTKLNLFVKGNVVIPDDVPRRPVLLSVVSKKSFGALGLNQDTTSAILTVGLIEWNSIPYIIRSSQEKGEVFQIMTNDTDFVQ